VEKAKYENTKQKSKQIVAKIITKDVSEKQLIELYDSQGITPEIIKEEASKLGKNIKVPDDFYAKVSERHDKQEQVHATKKELNIDLTDVPETEALYFDDYKKLKFSAKVLKVVDKYAVLDKTAFYPTSGGQLHDIGTIQGNEVTDVVKQGKVIIHIMKDKMDLSVEGQNVDCEIDLEQRQQLAQHHTSTHIVNAAAKRVLGNHVNQAGAKKTKEKAHIDLTHFKSITDEEMKAIEREANKIVKEAIPIRSKFMPRDKAEKSYGMNIYQGRAAPGQELRIVEIPEVDVECCGGTHLHNTSEAGEIKILKTTKISDGVVRLTFVAGGAASKEGDVEHSLLKKTAKVLGVKNSEVPSRAEELFQKWKKAKKAVKKNKKLGKNELKLTQKISEKLSDEELLQKTARVFKTQPEHVPKTAKRFLKELNELKSKLE
jgi:alanyl-tRNA synthetase